MNNKRNIVSAVAGDPVVLVLASTETVPHCPD
jgi:hypothetical protein